MNDLQANLILNGDSSGAVKALTSTNKSAKQLATSLSDVDTASSKTTKNISNNFKSLETDGVRGVKEFGGAIGDLESGLLALEGGGIGAVASIENFANVLLNMPIALNPATLAVGAAIGGLALLLTDLSAQGREATASMRQVLSLTDDYYRALVTGTKDSIQSQIEALEVERQIANLKRENYIAELDRYKNLSRSLVDIAGALNFAGYEDVSATAQALDDVNSEIANMDTNLNALRGALDDSSVQARTTEQALEELTKAENELQNERMTQAKALQDLRIQSIDLVDAFEDRLASEQKLLELQEKRKAEDDALTASYDAQKQALTDLFNAQDEAVKQAEKQANLQSTLADIENSVLEKRNETAEKLSELETTYNKEAIARQKEFEQKRKDIEDSFNLTRLQAFASQDAASLYFATLGKQASLTGLDQDQAEADAKAKESYQERAKEIQAELEVFKKAQDEKIEAEKQAFAESQQREEIAQQQREERARAFAALEDQLSAERTRLTKERAEEDRQARIEADRAALQEQLQNIELKRQAELSAYNDIIAQINKGRVESEILQGGSLQTANTMPLLQFANGGIFNRPTRLTNALIAEKEPEAIIPLSQLGAMGNVSLSIPVTVQGDASEQTIKLIQDVVKSEGMAIVKAVSDTMRLQGRPK